MTAKTKLMPRWYVSFALTIIAIAFLTLSTLKIPLDSENLMLLVLIGFAAQLINGAIGMAYGVVSNSFLLSIGLPPALASAGIHTAEIFTTLASGVFHLKLGNVDKLLFSKLVISGVLGGIIGAYVLSSAQTSFMKTVVNLYLLAVGVTIIIKSVRVTTNRTPSLKGVNLLGGVGGFLDAIGGGGWGPIVTSTLIVKNHNPRLAIGSVNLAEFFVTLAESIVFS